MTKSRGPKTALGDTARGSMKIRELVIIFNTEGALSILRNKTGKYIKKTGFSFSLLKTPLL